jgi:hypothetical protein
VARKPQGAAGSGHGPAGVDPAGLGPAVVGALFKFTVILRCEPKRASKDATAAPGRVTQVTPPLPARRRARGMRLRESQNRRRRRQRHPPVRNDADAVGHAFGYLQDVRGHDDGAAGAHAFAQHVLHLPRGAGIEPGQRLIENDDARPVHQRTGERHLLAHALGKALAALIGMAGEIEPIEQFLRAHLRQRRLDAPQPGDEFQIFLRRELVVDHRLIGNPRHHPLRRHRIGECIDAGDMDRAGVRPHQSRDHAQRRGLAGAVRAEQRIEPAGTHGEVETVDRRALEAFHQAADFESEWRRGSKHGRVPSS